MSSSTTYCLCPSVAATHVDDASMVLLHLSKQTYFQLNRTGTRLWTYVDENDGATIRELVEALHAGREDVSRAEVQADVKAFLHDLMAEDLLIEK